MMPQLHAVDSRESSTRSPGGRIRVCRVDPALERATLVGLLKRNLTVLDLESCFDWLFLENPLGPALVWIAEDTRSGRPIGMASAHRRIVRVDGESRPALNLGSFAIDEEFRVLGPALQLFRESLAPVRSGRYALAFDHPSDEMASLYRRLRIGAVGRMQRFVLPVSVRRFLRRVTGSPTLARCLTPLGDAVLRARPSARRASTDLESARHSGPCGLEFDRFDVRHACGEGIEGVRSAAYLNWRYRSGSPWTTHEIYTARRGSQLAGYAVLRTFCGIRNAVLVELEPYDDPAAQRALLAQIVEDGRALGETGVDTLALAGSRTATRLRELGFVRREVEKSFRVYASDRLGSGADRPEPWWMIEGDRDV